MAYPVSCSPQAWASGSLFMLMQACWGSTREAPARVLHVRDPVLPDFLNRLTRERSRDRRHAGLTPVPPPREPTLASLLSLDGDRLQVRMNGSRSRASAAGPADGVRRLPAPDLAVEPAPRRAWWKRWSSPQVLPPQLPGQRQRRSRRHCWDHIPARLHQEPSCRRGLAQPGVPVSPTTTTATTSPTIGPSCPR